MSEKKNLTLGQMEEESEMSLLAHLNELRVRLTWAAGALAVTTIIGFFFAERLLNFLLLPYAESLGREARLQTLRPDGRDRDLF